MDTITKPVGIRNGWMKMPNIQADLETITGLLDRIPLIKGGTADIPGIWSSDRSALINEVAAAIVVFQKVNHRPIIDGVIDPTGGSLRLLNQLAGPAPVKATVVREDVNSQLWVVADPLNMAGTDPLVPKNISPLLTRKLIRVSGSSIRWFGVVLPANMSGNSVPHLFFTPSPWQGGYQDGGYELFTSWTGLWDKYTSIIGSQLVVSNAPQILVIPFYKNSQSGKLGDFLENWREVVSVVIAEAIDSVDPLMLRNRFEFTRIFTSSFSNGITTLQNFHTHGANVASMAGMSFDLDGQAAGSVWHPNPGISYRNTVAPHGINPNGMNWYVGGRFAKIRPRYVATSDHNLCPFLLLHGLSMFGR